MKIRIGDTFSTKRTITEDLVRRFAELTGDFNPIHLDEEFAAGTRFGQRIAHGMLSGSFVSAVLGNELSVTEIVYLGQTFRFLEPVFIGDTVTSRATVNHIREDKPVVTLETICENQRGERVIEGEAVIMLLDKAASEDRDGDLC